MKIIFSLLALFIGLQTFSQQAQNKVVWITIDGLRWQEVFGGADSLLINQADFVEDIQGLSREFWKEKPEERRKVLMPFIWKEAISEGTLLGNRWEGNKFELTNNVVYSYPGYQEILTGYADDTHIKGNQKIKNPNKTLLEVVNGKERFNGKVLVFGSWDVFPYILNEERSKLPVNAGYRSSLRRLPTEKELLLNKIQEEVPRRWSGVRFDTFTHNYALEAMKNDKPELIYIAYGEPDDFAHEGRYDDYLKSTRKVDGMIKELWDFVEKDPFYKGKTTFILTTDHGRGEGIKENTWRHHSSGIKNSNQTWFMAFGNTIRKQGEVKKSGKAYTNQIAKTVAQILGVEYDTEEKAGEALPVTSTE